MNIDQEPECPVPRSAAAIFADLRELAQSDGALHEISGIIYRDWVLTIDVQVGKVIDDPERRWSTTKLNKNELMLLLGLLIQCTDDRTYSVQNIDDNFAARADQLLREFHDRVLFDGVPIFDRLTGDVNNNPDSIGMFAREAIYYGSDSFYLHQFSHFSRLRYREDATWLLQNAGMSIRSMIDIAKFVGGRINNQMTTVGHLRNEGHNFDNGDLTNSLLIAKADLRRKFGVKVDAFLKKFAIPITDSNLHFSSPFAINAIMIAPIVDLGEHLYVPNQYRLFESIYESPFYWMIGDRTYADTEAVHRGRYLEKTATHILRSVFGEKNVFENVTLKQNVSHIAGEIDVLVRYGEFVIVVQAKSKRVTLAARSGDSSALKNDFEGAIRAPYHQAIKCIELIKSGAKCLTKDGKELAFHSLPRFFPMVVLSDPFPAATLLARNMLERGGNIAPVVWDLGVLDCVARLLPTPIEMIFYLKSRSDVFDSVISDSEYNYLGFHIRSKLALHPDADGMLLDRDFATVVDDFMIAADLDIRTDRPLGVLERLQIPVMSELLAELKSADPRIASVVVDLYDFSSAALEDLSAIILNLREEISSTGKAIKAFSITTATGGLTYAVTRRLGPDAHHAARAIGAKHKYDSKADRWYIILDSIETVNPIDGLLPLVWPWAEDENEAKNSEQIGKLFNSRYEPAIIGDAAKKRAGTL